MEKKYFYSTKIKEYINIFKTLLTFTYSPLMPYKLSNNTRKRFISVSPNNTCNLALVADVTFNRKMLEIFRPSLAVEAWEIISTVSNKSCNLNLLHNWFLKKYVGQLLPLITAMPNW